MKNRKLATTLCIIHQHPRILLGMKKRGFGVGSWNGFGGKVSIGETIENAAKRELREESGVEIENLNKIGVLEFEFKNNPEIIEVHIFKSENFTGGLSLMGSTGISISFARITSPHFLQYHTGNGMPKYL